jgi:HlyD family secretion protein
MRPRLLIGAILLMVIAAAVAFQRFRASAKAPLDRILVSGNIELEQVEVGFKIAGRLVERTVDEGDAVKKGMVLARLDRDQLVRQRQQQEAALRSAEALMAQAETSLELQKRTVEAELEVRRAEVRTAEARLRELRQGARPQELEDAAASVEGAQAEFQRAQRDLERAQRLQKNDDIPMSQLEAARTRFESTQAVLKQAQGRLALLQAGTRAETIDASEAQLARAQAALKEGAATELQVTRSEQELAVRSAEIDRTRAQIAMTDTQLQETEVRSPIDGIVLVKSAQVGEILAPGSPVMAVGDLEHPWLRAYIGERDLGRVKIGSRVRVTTDSFPGKAYKGQVSFISSEAEFTPKQIQTTEGRVRLVYRIKIAIENPQRELKSNMPADAEILLAE